MFPNGHVEHSDAEAAPTNGSFFPGVHAKQALDGRLSFEPVEGQAMQLEAPATPEYVPNAQYLQTSSLAAPSTSANLPAGQLVQFTSEAAPTLLEYLPALHFKHNEEEFDPVVVEYRPVPHSMHPEAPSLSEKEPAVQSSHALAPVVFENVPLWQFLQVELVFEAIASEYLPTPHTAQLDIDSMAEYLPGSQSLQVSGVEAPSTAEDLPG